MIFRRPDPELNRPAEQLGYPVGGSQPYPVTSERIGALLTAHEYHYSQDADGDLTGVWDGNQYWFILGGVAKEVLQIRGRWSQTLPNDQRLATLLAVNDWNRDHLWPKVYLREEGDLVLYAEVSIDLECGVTDAQLQDIIACGLQTADQFFTGVAITAE